MLTTSIYDRSVSFLLAVLTIITVTVLVLFGLWMGGVLAKRLVAVPVQILPRLGTGSGMEDITELNTDVVEPGLDTLAIEPTMFQNLERLADILETNAAAIHAATMQEDNWMESGRTGDGRTRGSGDGTAGDARVWELMFPDGNTLSIYAAQLDFFHIELGVLEPEGKVRYVKSFTKETPDTRIGEAAAETRYYLTWKQGTLIEADRKLLAKAKIETDNRSTILKFLSTECEQNLATLEKRHAENKGRKPEQVRATFFGVRPLTGLRKGYEFHILDQTYR